jgi:protein SCO1/2
MRRRLLFPLSVVVAALAIALLIAATGGFGGSDGSGGGPGSGGTTGSFLTGGTLPAGVAGRAAPPFDLNDARGGRLASAALLGRPYVVTFLYTHCPDVCPLIGEEIHSALSALGADASKLAVVGISVDPHGDSPSAARAWLALHREPANFHYLIGSQRQLSPVWKGYSAAPQIAGDPQSSHTAAIWLIDRHGSLAALVDAGVAINTGNLAHDLRVLIERA